MMSTSKITFTFKKPVGKPSNGSASTAPTAISNQPHAATAATLASTQTVSGQKRPFSQISESSGNGGTKILLNPSSQNASAAGQTKPAQIPVKNIFADEEDEANSKPVQKVSSGLSTAITAAADEPAAADGTAKTGAGTVAAAEPDAEDLDALVGRLVKEAGVPDFSISAQLASKVVTLNELLHPGDDNNINNDKDLDDKNKMTQQRSEQEEEEYHRKFIQSLRREMKPAKRPRPAPVAAPEGAAAADDVVVEFAGGSGMDFDDDISYDISDKKEDVAPPQKAAVQDEEDAMYRGEEWQTGGKSALEILNEKLSKKDLRPVDHSEIEYLPFRKCLYIQAKEIAAMTPEQVAAVRDDCEIKVRGKNIPNPIDTWEQTGLPDRVLAVLERQFSAPFAIQRQALPVIMSGRDVIAVARTGSGKTLGYILPAIRQVMDQPPLREGDGPIVLILAPSRELVTQIYRECRKFTKVLDIRVTAIYGGASTGEQIAELKRGAAIVVATPGRLIDLLTLNAGRVMSLQRVCYVVLDEADRMFDMGFEPQIAKVLANVRPDRQTVLFSATFPVHVEQLARKVLRTPVEIVVGGRSKASSDIAQFVEIHEENEKFPRLLQLLGEWYERGSVLVFVDTKEHCDMLYADLMKLGYPSVSLHGGKDQVDRDQSIADFKTGVATILIATSVAGRGLDVKDLVLVINYSCPNHLEDYVHRVGRTGRAGRKGTAYTFISPQEGVYAADLIRALKDAKQPEKVDPALQALADDYAKKVAAGEAKKKHSGYTTRGYKFDESEMSAAQAAKDAQRKIYELEAGIKDVSEILAEEDDKRRELAAEEEFRDEGLTGPSAGENGEHGEKPKQQMSIDQAQLAQLRSKLAAVSAAYAAGFGRKEDVEAAQAALSAAETASASAPKDAVAAAFAVAQVVHHQLGLDGSNIPQRFTEELEVNDYPVRARTRVVRRDNFNQIEEATGCMITVRGVYVEPGKKLPAGERKMYLHFEGPSEYSVRKAKSDIRRGLEEETLRVSLTVDKGGYSKF